MSLPVRAFLAILLTVGFYVLALVMAGGLLVFAVAGITAGHINRWTVLAIVGGLGVAWSIVPRAQAFRSPGPRIDLAANPYLAAHLEDVARRVGEPLPRDVYLTLEMNAGVSQRGGLLGMGASRYMVLGLPLMQLLTVSELRAVLAHEFGHFRGGDTSLGPWVYSARRAMARTLRVARGTSVVLWLPFRGYAALFFRITQAVARAQEHSADALAASAVGAGPLASALRKFPGGSLALSGYLRSELLPTVRAGYEVPVAAGFLHYATRPAVQEAAIEFAQEQLAVPSADPYDSHPPTAERLARLARLPSGPDPAAEPAAVVLLSQLDMLEQAALAAMRRQGAPPLRPLAWEQVGAEVILPVWRTQVREGSALLAGATLGNLPEWARAAPALGARLHGPSTPAPAAEELTAAGIRLLAMAVGVALAGQGWSVESLPGEPVTFRMGERSLVPFETVRQLATGGMDAGGWLRAYHELGLDNAWLAAA